MGRIKTVLIKRTTNKLIKEYGDRFTKDYEKNKQLVDELIKDSSKKLRNTIAGYVTRIMKMKEKEEAI